MKTSAENEEEEQGELNATKKGVRGSVVHVKTSVHGEGSLQEGQGVNSGGGLLRVNRKMCLM